MPDTTQPTVVEHSTEGEPVRDAKPYEKREHVVEWFPAGEVSLTDDGNHRIEFICHGMTEDGSRYYPERTLEAAVASRCYENKMMFLNHGNPAADKARGHRDLRDWGATIVPGTVIFNAERNLEAVCHAHTQEALAILNDPIARQAVGLSHDAFIRTTEGTINNKKTRIVESIDQVLSVDLVPAGNTRGRVLESEPTPDEPQEADMALDELTVDQLREARPELVKQIEDANAAKVREAMQMTTGTTHVCCSECGCKLNCCPCCGCTMTCCAEGLCCSMCGCVCKACPCCGTDLAGVSGGTMENKPTPAAGASEPTKEANTMAETETVSKEEFEAVKTELAEVKTERAKETCAAIVAQVVDTSEGLGEAGRKRVKEMFAGQIIPATEIHAKVQEAVESEKAYQLELLREAGVRTKVTGAGGGSSAPNTEQAQESYKAEHAEWMRREGYTEEEIKAHLELA